MDGVVEEMLVELVEDLPVAGLVVFEVVQRFGAFVEQRWRVLDLREVQVRDLKEEDACGIDLLLDLGGLFRFYF